MAGMIRSLILSVFLLPVASTANERDADIEAEHEAYWDYLITWCEEYREKNNLNECPTDQIEAEIWKKLGKKPKGKLQRQQD